MSRGCAFRRFGAAQDEIAVDLNSLRVQQAEGSRVPPAPNER